MPQRELKWERNEMSYETIILEKKDYIATITMNRPDRLNALNDQIVDELNEAFAEVDRDDGIRVVVITGAGRAFSSGADLKGPRTGDGDPMRSFTDRIFAAFQIDKPIIASINGLAVGGGCTMTLSCDIRIASEEAKFQLPFTRLGTCTELGSTYLLPRLVGMGKASELILTSKMIDAREAKEIGLVNEVVPASELARVSYEMAGSIAKLPPLAVQLNKRGLLEAMHSDLPTMLRYEALALAHLLKTEDHKEAVQAFMEKREPVYKGK